MSEQQIKNLQQNLTLKLEQACIALLHRTQRQYNDILQLAINWTAKHINSVEAPTQKFLAILKLLKGTQIELKAPDISASLRSLRNSAKSMEFNIPIMGSVTDNNNSTNVAMN